MGIENNSSISSNYNLSLIERKELSKEYYTTNLIYNLKILELLSKDINETTIVSVITYINEYKKKDIPNKQNLKLFIKGIIATIYEGSDKDLDNFNKKYIVSEKKEDFSAFITEFYNHIQKLSKSSNDVTTIIDVAAWIDYTFQKNKFFIKDNQVISWLLVTYLFIEYKLQLPQILNKEDLNSNLPQLFNDESLETWKKYYHSQFGAWEIGTKETFDQSLNSKETMLDSITRTVDDIREMKDITGETSLTKLVVHNIDRAILHALIIEFVSEYQIQDENQLIELVGNYYEKYMSEEGSEYFSDEVSRKVIEHKPKKIILAEQIIEREKYLNGLFDKVASNKFFLSDNKYKKEDVIQCQNIMAEKEKLINSHANRLPLNSPLKDDFDKKLKVFKHLVIDQMLRQFIQDKANLAIKDLISDSLPKLEKRDNFAQVSWIIAGGPASGKTSIVKLAEKDLAEDKINTAILNPDYYKNILLDPKKVDDPVKHAELTHVESSFINKKIMEKIKYMFSEGQSPDILFDTVKASQDKIGITQGGNATINIYMATCSPEEAVRRAFDRGRRHGRFVPTEIVLDGHKEATRLLPKVLANNKVVFRLFNTEVPQNTPPIEIASIQDRSTILDIHNARLMLDFILKAKIDIKAKSPDEVYTDDVKEDKIKQISICLMKYIKYGLTLRFGYQAKNGKYKTSAIISAKEGVLITNIKNFIDNIADNNCEKNEFVASLIFNLSQYKINNKKLNISIHSGKTSRKDFYIENGKCLYSTQMENDFSTLYGLIINKLNTVPSHSELFFNDNVFKDIFDLYISSKNKSEKHMSLSSEHKKRSYPKNFDDEQRETKRRKLEKNKNDKLEKMSIPHTFFSSTGPKPTQNNNINISSNDNRLSELK